MPSTPTPQMPGLLSRFPASFFPSPSIARHGAEQARYGKEPFKLTAYKVELFDMSNPEERRAYCGLMERLMPLIQDAKCTICKNELQLITSATGQAWHRYVEWFEYRLNETSLTGPTDNDAKASEDKSDDASVQTPALFDDGAADGFM